ncbi:MAG: undecaprenyl-phosphate galactose phosphotransferase WbaP [Pirellulaceae bacterium]|nr:undecaprenyl-phosphate galactose phosphotransferase WbaP [Pirellulaceae bacterium]
MIETQSSGLRDNVIASTLAIAQPEINSPAILPLRWSLRRYWISGSQGIRFALPLIVSDVIVTSACLLAAAAGLALCGMSLSTENAWSLLGAQVIAVSSCLLGLRLYSNVGMHPVVELERVVTGTIIYYLLLILVVVLRSSHQVLNEALCLAISGVACLLLLPSIRHFVRCYLGSTTWWRQPVLIFGQSERAEQLINELNQECHLGWKPVGYVESFQDQWEGAKNTNLCLGDEESVPEIAAKENVFWGIVDASLSDNSDLQAIIDRHHPALPNIVSISFGRTNTSLFAYGIESGMISGICYRSKLALLLPNAIKRTFDVVASLLGMICLSPLYLAIAVAIRCTSRGPVFYSHERIGRNGKSFRIWKFRTMVQNAEHVLEEFLTKHPKLRSEWQNTQKLAMDPRITSVGRLLRRTSMDELPQLWNVLNGSMSLVGPRPVTRSEVERYGNVFGLYTRTRPGITGLWQVNGRNKTTYQERLRYVSFYARNWSLWLDWYILLKTIRVVIFCKGAY